MSLYDNPGNPSPLMGEGKGGGEKDGDSSGALFPPPLYPLPRGEGKLVVGQALITPLGKGDVSPDP